MWLPQTRALRWIFRVIAPDLRGYGKSKRSPKDVYTQNDFACDLASLLDHLAIKQVCVVGLSMGGQIAMEFARSFPQRTAAIVLAATSAQPERPEGVIGRNEAAARILKEGVVPVGAEMLCKLIGSDALKNCPAIASTVFRMICGADPIGAAAALRGRAARPDYRPSLSEYSGPSMIILGTDDAYTSLHDAQELQSIMHNCRLEVFEGIGHLPNLEDEDRFNRCLYEFLTSSLAASS
jgi:pimeloyl-ACP methyl ester carboxylesterase